MFVNSDYDGLTSRRNIDHRHSMNGRRDDDVFVNKDDDDDDDDDDDEAENVNVQLNGHDARRRPDSPVLRPLPSMLFIVIIVLLCVVVII